MLDERVQQIAEVVCHAIVTNNVNYWWNVWKMFISVSRPCWQKISQGSPQDFRTSGCWSHDLCRRLSKWLICPSVWSLGRSIFYQYSFIIECSLKPAWCDGRNMMTNDAVRCSTQLGITRNQISRCLRLWHAEGSQAEVSSSKDSRAGADRNKWSK